MRAHALTHWYGEPVEVLRALWDVPRLEAYERIGSTNDRAKELASDRSDAFTVVVAQEQTAGRGRRGKNWYSPGGSGLWMSVILPGPPVPQMPLLVGLAVARAIQGLRSDFPVGIEWPNDLVVRGRKVGGILCEGMAGAAIAGIGVNVRSPDGGFPSHLLDRATSLEAEDSKPWHHNELAPAIVSVLKDVAGGQSAHLHPDVLQELAARDALAGRPVRTEEHGPGTARGIAADGSLLLERPDGSRVRVMAGSVRPA